MKDFIINYFIITIVTIYGGNSINFGEPAGDEEFKYVVSIQQDDEHRCSGTIIGEMQIVTAAHAVDGILPFYLSVVAGNRVVIPQSVEAIPVQHVYRHFLFKRTESIMWPYQDSWENDIAILKLSRKFTWGPNIAPAPLIDTAMELNFCDICIMPRWNYEAPYSKKSVSLYWNFVHRTHHTDQLGNPINLARHQQCFADLHKLIKMRNEDVGSPIFCDKNVVGFVVKGGEVAERPSIFLELFPYSKFLFESINDFIIDVRQGQFLYPATLWYFGEHIGNGIIYNAHHVIAIRNSIEQTDRDFLKVIVGKNLVEENDYVLNGISVKSIVDDDQVKSSAGVLKIEEAVVRDRIVILNLEQPISLEFLAPLQLAKFSDVVRRQMCRFLRWVREYNAGEVVMKLKTSPAIILSVRECRRRKANPSSREFCAINPYSKILGEKEDVGNPILCNDKIIGLMVKVAVMTNSSQTPIIFQKINP